LQGPDGRFFERCFARFFERRFARICDKSEEKIREGKRGEVIGAKYFSTYGEEKGRKTIRKK
jgi:hypothetical protein